MKTADGREPGKEGRIGELGAGELLLEPLRTMLCFLRRDWTTFETKAAISRRNSFEKGRAYSQFCVVTGMFHFRQTFSRNKATVTWSVSRLSRSDTAVLTAGLVKCPFASSAVPSFRRSVSFYEIAIAYVRVGD